MKSSFDKNKIYLVAAIRKIWRWSLKRRNVLKAATRCYICGKAAEEYQADHVSPVGPAPRTWDGWDEYLKRMFEGELKPACKKCHKLKSRKERQENAERRKREVLDAQPNA